MTVGSRRIMPTESREDPVADLITAHVAVARRLARRFDRRGCALEDLEQTALLALVKAAQKFDPESGHDFLSYAVPCITGEIKRYFRDFGWMVRPPRQVQELQAAVEVELIASTASGEPASDHAVAIRLDIPVSAVRRIRAAPGCFSPTSLDAPMAGTNNLRLGDTVDDGSSARAYDAAEARVVLAPALDVLATADRQLLQQWFLEELTQDEIGQSLGISQSQVSRKIRDVLSQLRRSIGAFSEDARLSA